MDTQKQSLTDAFSVTMESPTVIQHAIVPLLAATVIIKKPRETPRFIAQIEAILRRSADSKLRRR